MLSAPVRFVALATLLAHSAFASVIWKGDFETGDTSQWNEHQLVSKDRAQVVTTPVHQGHYAVQVTVKHGDNPINSSGNRSELVNGSAQAEGSESYYAWSTQFASNYPSETAWQVFTQWHQPEDCCGSPPVQFVIAGETIGLTLSTAETRVWTAPLVRGVWHDFVIHLKFSDDPSIGFVELWYDGAQVVPKTYGATHAGDYFKQGLYRSDTIRPDGVVFHDGMIQGTTLEDVMPQKPPPDAGSPGVDSGVRESAGAPSAKADAGATPPAPPNDGAAGSNPAPDVNVSKSLPPPTGGCSVSGGMISALALMSALLFLSRLLAGRRVRIPAKRKDPRSGLSQH